MCVGFALANGLVFAGMFAFINVSPLLFMQGFGVSQGGFAVLFAVTSFGVILGGSVNAWLVRRHTKPRAVLDVAMALAAVAALALLGASLMRSETVFSVTAIAFVYMTMFGVIVPNAMHEAVHPLPDIAGLASGVFLSGQMLFGAIGGATAAALHRDASALGVTEVMAAAACLALALYAFALRRRVEA